MDKVILDEFEEILDGIRKWKTEGSSWSVRAVITETLNIAKHKSFKGSSYLKIPVPLKGPMRGLINIKNIKDDLCFRWSHLAHEFPVAKDPQCITKYIPHKNKLNYAGAKFPVTMEAIPRIDRQNNIAINVFLWTGDSIITYRPSPRRNEGNVFNLLLIYNGVKSVNHYLLIKDLNRLLYLETKHKEKKLYLFELSSEV